MKLIKSISTIITILALTFSFSAHALNLKEARAKKYVIELPTGYVKSTNSAATELAKEVNQKRKNHYVNIAKKNNISVEQVGMEAAKKIKKKIGK